MGPFFKTLFVSCGHVLYISVQSVLNIWGHVKEMKKGIGVGVGNGILPYSKISLVIINIIFVSFFLFPYNV
jgi:hypothetical protein